MVLTGQLNSCYTPENAACFTFAYFPNTKIRILERAVQPLVAHEFGHVLGLGHCLDCDSAMNYSWHTRQRVLVTEADVQTFLLLISEPNGSIAR